MYKLRLLLICCSLLLSLAGAPALLGGVPPASTSGAAALQQEELYAEVVSVSGAAFACPRLLGCTATAAKGTRVYVRGEVRTGPTGNTDLRSRNTIFRLRNNAVLQFQDVTNAIQRLVLKGGRLFVSHDPQGRDIISIDAGKKRVEAVDTTFSIEITDDLTSADDNVDIAVPDGGGSLKITLDSGKELELDDGKKITIPADADEFAPVEDLEEVEEVEWREELDEWEETEDVDLFGAPEYIPETGQTISTEFADYWEENNGVQTVGYPISDDYAEPEEDAARAGWHLLSDDEEVTAQCFERALLEFHPAYRGTDFGVLLARLGALGYQERYGAAGAPPQTPNRTPGQSQYFPETGRWLGGIFRQYWLATGGLAAHGYPISDEFVEASPLDPGKRYRVQYFERSLFELHPEFAGTPFEVSLAQLGRYYCDNAGAPVPAEAVVDTEVDESEVPPDPDETPEPDETPDPDETPAP